MICCSNLSKATHYEAIGVKEDASYEEMRKTYRSIILNYHPDKLQKTASGECELGNKFLEVQKAWEVLGDSRSRALYDNELRVLRQDSVTSEDVCLEDMTVEDVDGGGFELSYGCRCGDYFGVDSSDLANMGYSFSNEGSRMILRTSGLMPASIVLPCGSCSLRVRLCLDSSG